MHSFVSAVITCNEAWRRSIRPARAPPWSFDHADRIQSLTLQTRPGDSNQESTVRVGQDADNVWHRSSLPASGRRPSLAASEPLTY